MKIVKNATERWLGAALTGLMIAALLSTAL